MHIWVIKEKWKKKSMLTYEQVLENHLRNEMTIVFFLFSKNVFHVLFSIKWKFIKKKKKKGLLSKLLE
jgi:hypothetical protein